MAANRIDLTKETLESVDFKFETNLIKAVKQQQCLYAKNHPYFEHKLQNDLAWLRVSKEVNKLITDCINKWYSLVQTFLHLSRLESTCNSILEACDWPHYKTFKKMQPLMIENYVELLKLKCEPQITYDQQDALLKEMEHHSKDLMSCTLGNAERQKIWTDIASKLNAANSGEPFPLIQWQKVWWDLKQGLRKKLEMKDRRILKICGISSLEEDRINAQLDSYIEFDDDKDQFKCKKCGESMNGTSTKDLCKKCSETDISICDICCEAPSTSACDTTDWTLAAKEMIPSLCRNKAKLLMCQLCCTCLKKKASLTWKVCRICAKEDQQLENFLCSSFQHIREVFFNATRFTFSVSDGLPCFVCFKCIDQLMNFNQFYINFASTQTVLLEIHDKNFIGEASPEKLTSKPNNNETTNDSQETVAIEEVVEIRRSHRLSQVKLPTACQDIGQQEDELLIKNLNTQQNEITQGVHIELTPSQPVIALNINQDLSSDEARITSTSLSEVSGTPSQQLAISNIYSLDPSAEVTERIKWQLPDISIEKVPHLNPSSLAAFQRDISESSLSHNVASSSAAITSQHIPSLESESIGESSCEMNPLLRRLLTQPALEVTASPIGYFSPSQMPSTSKKRPPSSSGGKKSTTRRSNKSITSKASGTSPTKRHFSGINKTKLSDGVIVILDDTPPIESQPSQDQNAMQIDIGSAAANLNPLTIPTSLGGIDLLDSLNEGLMVSEKPIRQQTEAANTNDEYEELISPALLIDYAVNQAYKKNTTAPQANKSAQSKTRKP